MRDSVLLHTIVPGRPFRIQTDASGYAVGGLLEQQVETAEGAQWRPVAFYSKKLTG